MEIKLTSKFYLPLLIVSVVLFITVFFPWKTASGSSANGMHDWGVVTLIMSLVGIELAFITSQKLRTISSIIAGVLALLGVILYWTTVYQGAGTGFGIVLSLIASIAFIAIGFMDYYKVGITFKPKK